MQFLTVLRHFGGLFEKSKESNGEIMGVYFLPFFSRMLLLKDTGVKGAWMSSKNFQKTLFGIVI